MKCEIGDAIINPSTLANDGIAEVRYDTRDGSIGVIVKALELAAQGGLSFYDVPNLFKASTVKIINQNFDAEGNKKPTPLTADGELYYVKDFVKHEVLKEELEVIVDLEAIYNADYIERPERLLPKIPEKKSSPLPMLLLVGALVGFGIYYFTT